MSRLIWLIPGIFFGLAATSLSDTTKETEKLLKFRKAKLESAQQTYNVVWKNFSEGPARGVELPYRWSCRLLEVERQMSDKRPEQIAAVQRHAERMRNVERLARALYRERLNTVDEVTAAEYYRMEAEIWLLQARE